MAILALYALAFIGIWLAFVIAPWVIGRRISPGAGRVAAFAALLALAALWAYAFYGPFRDYVSTSGGGLFSLVFWVGLISVSVLLSSGLYLLRRR